MRQAVEWAGCGVVGLEECGELGVECGIVRTFAVEEGATRGSIEGAGFGEEFFETGPAR